MAGPSYADAVVATTPPPSYATVTASSTFESESAAVNAATSAPYASPAVITSSEQQQRIRQLMQPPPTTMSLKGALQLLQPVSSGQSVYLIDIQYLRNWLIWALHQTVPKNESQRAREAVRLAALKMGLDPPAEGMEYENPGPIDSIALALEGHPLLLNPCVRCWAENEKGNDMAECSAVPEGFYETLRSVHGVLCDDGFSVSFQPFSGNSERLILHHQRRTQSQKQNGKSELRESSVAVARPIEFRRKLICEPNKTIPEQPQSLMDKLLMEEQQQRPVQPRPVVEVHPMRLSYSIVTEETTADQQQEQNHRQQGYVLVSRDAPAVDALVALMHVAEPNKATQCVRLWSRRVYSSLSNNRKDVAVTPGTDGYELVDLQGLNEKIKIEDGEKKLASVLQWTQRHHVSESTEEVELIIETRKTVNSPWPREPLEFENRIKVGDFCDAQDVAGCWYEAVIREVEEEAVIVHYIGWASRWDCQLKRRQNSPNIEGLSSKIKSPAPLWSQTDRWRERISVGDIVEVRDSSSIVEKPKWYKGEIKKIGKVSDSVRELNGGADLETYPVNGASSKKAHLLLLNRTQQVLVEVPQEKSDKAGPPPISSGEDDLAAPPYIRWINLYGEEICRIGTHLKSEEASGPATLVYEYDTRRRPVEVMKSHPMHGSGFLRESLRGVPPAPGSVGLHNLGNSCFLNSTVQCLNHIEPLTKYFLNDTYSNDLNRKNPLGSGGDVTIAYSSLLKQMWGGEHSVLAPRKLKQTVANFAPQFDNTYQHDSQEFCQFLMDGLHEDLNRVGQKPYVEELEGFGMDDQIAAIESWRKHLLRHDSVIVDHCQGIHRSHLTCPHCGRESIKFDIFSSISLPIPTSKDATSKVNLQDCLEKFMEGEQLDERNAWYCPSCRMHVCALKMIALWSVPDILILHLKRFTFDTCMTSGGMLRAKIDAKVDFPINGLDLTNQVLGPIDKENPPVYKLFGVSEHVGPTANSGHYTATVRNSIDGKWYRCNDSHVGQTTGEASITGGAYLLFYQRAKGTSKWAGMHKVMKERNVNPYGGLETDQEGFTKVKAKKKK